LAVFVGSVYALLPIVPTVEVSDTTGDAIITESWLNKKQTAEILLSAVDCTDCLLTYKLKCKYVKLTTPFY